MNVAVGLVLLLAAFCSGQQQCEPATSQECPLHTLQCCDANFQDALNLTAACGNQQSFSEPGCMRRGIEALYELGGPNGLLKVCSAFNQYDNCLGPAEESCTSALWYVQHGFKPFVAEEFVRLFHTFHFACGGGLNAYLQHDTCMALVFRSEGAVLRQCRDQFFSNVQQDPNRVCIYMDLLIHCYQRPFANACGGEAGYWACEYERTAAAVFLPQCTSNCGMVQQGNIG